MAVIVGCWEEGVVKDENGKKWWGYGNRSSSCDEGWTVEWGVAKEGVEKEELVRKNQWTTKRVRWKKVEKGIEFVDGGLQE